MTAAIPREVLIDWIVAEVGDPQRRVATRTLRRMLANLGLARVNRQDDVEDAFCDACAVTWERLDRPEELPPSLRTISSRAELRSLLLRRATWIWLDGKRARDRLRRLHEAYAGTIRTVAEGPSPEGERAVVAAIGGLPPRQREVMQRHLAGEDDATIARAMDLAEPTVRSHRRDARRALAPVIESMLPEFSSLTRRWTES